MQNSIFFAIELMKFINSIAKKNWLFLTKKLRLENGAKEFGIAGNPNKGHSVCSQLDQTEPWYCHRIPSILAGLSHGLYSCSRARVALGRELQLPMSFSWPFFPGLDQDLFPPMVFLVFWDSIPKRCKGVHSVDLGESFPNEQSLAKIFASRQPRTSPKKVRKSSTSRKVELKH